MSARPASPGYRSVPSHRHEERRAMLETVATLAGFTANITLPYSVIPDVSRISLESGSIFIGEAKESETPQDFNTMARIEKYMQWLLQKRPSQHPDLFCVCHPAHHGAGWYSVLETIADAVDINSRLGGQMVLSYEAVVTWVLCFGRKTPPLPTGHNEESEHSPQLGYLARHTARP